MTMRENLKVEVCKAEPDENAGPNDECPYEDYGAGFGDLVMSSWIPGISYYTTGIKKDLLQLFNRKLLDRPEGTEKIFHKCWAADLRAPKDKPRIEVWLETLGL